MSVKGEKDPYMGAQPQSQEQEQFTELRLEVAIVDATAMNQALGQVSARGILLSTLAEEQQRTPDCLQRLYALARVVHRNPTWTLDEYLHRFDSMEAVFIARHVDLYVGYTYLVQDEQHIDRLRQCMTGVRPEWRRRGIATALKARGLEYARQNGYRFILTSNHAGNTAILALNAKLGFQPHPQTSELNSGTESPPG
jgi:GNAT superfamily N-acetyltransferase